MEGEERRRRTGAKTRKASSFHLSLMDAIKEDLYRYGKEEEEGEEEEEEEEKEEEEKEEEVEEEEEEE